MKNIMKYTAAAAAMIVALSSCEEFEDYTVTVDGAPTLAYVNTGDENLFSTLVSHRPTDRRATSRPNSTCAAIRRFTRRPRCRLSMMPRSSRTTTPNMRPSTRRCPRSISSWKMQR